jgi:hypothetical protein
MLHVDTKLPMPLKKLPLRTREIVVGGVGNSPAQERLPKTDKVKCVGHDFR